MGQVKGSFKITMFINENKSFWNKKILCIKPRGIGDIVLSTIVLDNLHNHFPKAKIDYLTEHFAKYSVANNPLVNKVLTMHKTEFVAKVAWRVRKEKYNLIIDLWSNPRSAQITFYQALSIELDMLIVEENMLTIF